jgi:hypothetical protein
MAAACLALSVCAIFLIQTFDARAQQDLRKECSAAVFNNYLQTELALSQKQDVQSIMSVESTIAHRRLQEQFCLQFVQCEFPTENPGSIIFGTAFGTCLDDEVREEYDLPRKPRRPKR